MTTSNPKSNSKSRLERLEELAEKATPGPWTKDDAHLVWAESIKEYVAVTEIEEDDDVRIENTEYIAAANPSTLLDLIATVKALVSVEPIAESRSSEGLDDGRYCTYCNEWQDNDFTQMEHGEWVTPFAHASDCIWKIAHDKWLGE